MKKHVFQRWKKTIALFTAIAGLSAGISIATADTSIPVSDISTMNPHPIGYLDSWLPDRTKDITNILGFTEHTQNDGRIIYKPLTQDGTFTVNHVGSFTGADGAEHPLSAKITIPMTDVGGLDTNKNVPDNPRWAFEFILDGRQGLINVRVHLYSPDGTRIPETISTGFGDLDMDEQITFGEGVTHAYVRADNELTHTGNTFIGKTDSPNEDPLAPVAWRHYVGVEVNPDFEFTYGNPVRPTMQGTFFHPLIAQTSLHVTYEPNGGQGTKQDKLIVRDGNPYTVEKNPFTRANYQFTGWNTKADGTGDAYQPGTSIPIPEKNTIFYAQWKPLTATLTYDANGGNGTIPSHTGMIGSHVTAQDGFTREGYDFTGYIGSDGKTYQVGQPVTIPENGVELRAQWARKHVTLTVEPNGASGEPYTRTYEYGDTASPTNLWQRDGYQFTGFTTSPTGGNSLPDSFPLTQNMTVYAQWQAATHWYTLTPAHPTVYHVSVNPNGGLGDPISRDGHHNQTVSIPDGGYTRTGYHTDGYSLTPDCAVKLDKPEVTLTANTTVYQCWTRNQRTLTLNPNGADGQPRSQTLGEGDTVNTPGNPYQREHYQFTGWSFTPDGSQPVGDSLRMDTDTTLYAQWQHDQVTVTLNPNGADAAPHKDTLDYGSQYTPTRKYVRDGYQFMGWNTTADGSGTTVSQLTLTTDTTLYAQWKKAISWTDLTPAKPVMHTLTVNPNGGDGEPLTATGKHGSVVGIPDTKFTRNGYHTDGFSHTPGCTVKLDKPEVTLTADTTVYQCWEKDPEPEPKPEQPQQVHQSEPVVTPEAKSTPTPAQQTSGEEQKLASTGANVSIIALGALLLTVFGFLALGLKRLFGKAHPRH